MSFPNLLSDTNPELISESIMGACSNPITFFLLGLMPLRVVSGLIKF